MSGLLTPQKADLGWVIEIPKEIAQAMNIAEGSLAVLHPKNGSLEVEILTPPSPALKEEVQEVCEELKDTFEELKRRRI